MSSRTSSMYLPVVVLTLCILFSSCIGDIENVYGSLDKETTTSVSYEARDGSPLITTVADGYSSGYGYCFASKYLNVFAGTKMGSNYSANYPLVGLTVNSDGTGTLYTTTGVYDSPIPSTLFAQYDKTTQWVTPVDGATYTYSIGDTVAFKIATPDMEWPMFTSYPEGWLNYSNGTNSSSYEVRALSGKATESGTYTISWSIDDGKMHTTNGSCTIIIGSPSNTVSFSSEGSVIHTETVEPNATVQSYTPPTREGYIFDGWYTDTSFQIPFDFNTPITSDITLYAKWIENPVTITFMVEGNVHSTLQVPKGSVGVVYTPVMVEGIFAGWYYDDQFQRKYDATVPLNSDINLYALGVPPLIFTSEPTANATITPIYDGMVFFDATDSSGRYQIHWDFGDGNTSDEPIAYNNYTEPGRYTVTLTVTNIYGESATSTYEVDLRDGSAAENVKWFAIGALCVLAAGFVIRRIL